MNKYEQHTQCRFKRPRLNHRNSKRPRLRERGRSQFATFRRGRLQVP